MRKVEIIVELVDNVHAARAADNRATRRHLQAEIARAGIKHAIQKRLHRARNARIIRRAAEDEPIRLAHLLGDLIHAVVRKNAAIPFRQATVPAGDATADTLVSDLNRLGLNPLAFQLFRHCPKRHACVAIHARAAVDCDHFHLRCSFFCRWVLLLPISPSETARARLL
ncbi:hypothetical protein SDC9_187156 [bioreactor metagenome]|uniref:Uncharacterized protein n=1 Tax=bioreactor metagenome TaxID=1076179 RepID=A0A645HKV6_9ZZZZ